jgi:hypothetical protein
MISPKDHEKRQFVRVSMRLWAAACRVEPIPTRRAATPGLSKAASGQNEPPFDMAVDTLADWLLDMDEKLDRILDLLKGETPSTRVSVVETIDLSGSGMSMILDRPVKIGQLLKIKMKIEGFPLGIFKACGQVTRVVAGSGQTQGSVEVGVQFLDLQEADRDRLIAYCFRRHRHAIRAAGRTQTTGGSSDDD